MVLEIVRSLKEIEQSSEYDLYVAVTTNNHEELKTLLNSGMPAHTVLDEWKTPLHYTGSHAQNTKLLLEKKANPNAFDSKGCTPLFYAKNLEVAKMLVDHGAHLDQYAYNGETLMHCVKNPDIVPFLVGQGVNINAIDYEGRTPLHTACSTEVAIAMLESGADPSRKQIRRDQTPYEYQIVAGNPEVAEAIQTYTDLNQDILIKSAARQ